MRPAVIASGVLLLFLAGPRLALGQSMAAADELRQWVKVVTAHRPGALDEAVRYAAALRYSDRLRLHPAMQFFVRALTGESVAVRSDAQRQIMDLFRGVRTGPGLGPFIRRAAILHADAAIFADRFPTPVDDAPAPDRPRTGQRVPPAPPPLLFNDRYVLHRDGRVLGETPADWNLPFARSLLDLLLPNPASHTEFAPDRDFVAQWYHTLDAYLLAIGNHGDLALQLQHAAASLPDDANVLFDRACYAETLGLSYNQVLREDPNFWKAGGLTVALPGEDKTDAEAERLFRRAIEVNAGYAEARVRLARLLARRGLYDEAMVDLAQAQSSKPSRTVAFFAHLVGGRVAQAQARFKDSFDHYDAAAKLFPDAQSALVGASQAAVMASDVTRALSFVQRLSARSEIDNADPWRNYKSGAGRDATDLLAALWANTSR